MNRSPDDRQLFTRSFELEEEHMRFAKIVFRVAGVWGFAILTPLYFMFDRIGRDYPPPITHPEMYYGFLAVGLVWQFAFLVIASDPVRFRPIMIAAMLEKFGYMATLFLLYAQGRLPFAQLAATSPDLLLGTLFVAAFLKTPSDVAASARSSSR
jgi:hypothetical protein